MLVACEANVTLPAKQEIKAETQEVSGQLSTSDTIGVQFSVSEFPAAIGQGRFSLHVTFTGAMDEVSHVKVAWKVGETSYTETLKVNKGVIKINYLTSYTAPIAFSSSAEQILDVSCNNPRYKFRY